MAGKKEDTQDLGNRRLERLVVLISGKEKAALEALSESERLSKAALVRAALEKFYPKVFTPSE